MVQNNLTEAGKLVWLKQCFPCSVFDENVSCKQTLHDDVGGLNHSMVGKASVTAASDVCSSAVSLLAAGFEP